MKAALHVLIVFLLTLTLAACGGRDDDSYLRVMNASPDADELTVRVDNSEIVDNLRFRQFTEYRRVADGTRRIGVWQGWSSGVDPYRSIDHRFSERTFYTLIMLDWEGKMQSLVLTDENTAPTSGNGKLRFVHAGAAANSSVDVYITAPNANLATETPDITVVPFKGFSGYLTLPQGQYQVRVTWQGFKDPIADSGPVALNNSQIRTMVLVDNTSGAGLPYAVVGLTDMN